MTSTFDDFTIDELHVQLETAYNEANQLYGTPEYSDAIDQVMAICDELIRRSNTDKLSSYRSRNFKDLEQLEVSLQCYELCSNVSKALQVIEDQQISLEEDVVLKIIRQSRDRLITAVELCEEWRRRAKFSNDV